MKKLITSVWILLTVMALLLVQSCQKDELGNLGSVGGNSVVLKNASMNTFYSSTIPLGNGVARGWVKADKMGDPIEVGFTLSGKALTHLPEDPESYVFTLPKNKGQNFYNHLFVDWNPHGHEPEGIYDLPHFDFHFYIIPSADRMEIPLNMDQNYYDTPPANNYIPENYVELPGLVPGMGAHWIDVTSPEFNGETFTHTFIWGSYSGYFIFWEPMITTAYLSSLEPMETETFDVPQPSEYQKNGWYPMKYSITHSTRPDEYIIALTDLVYHEGTQE